MNGCKGAFNACLIEVLFGLVVTVVIVAIIIWPALIH